MHALNANRGYLVYSTEVYDLTLTGAPKFAERKWRPDLFNLTGFHVEPDSAPTFAQFFENARSPADIKVFTLTPTDDSGRNHWKMLDPNTAIVSGAAYWVWYAGEPDYQGPLDIDLPGTGDGMTFRPGVTELSLEVTNGSPNPLSFTLTQVGGLDPTLVPLSLVKSDPTADPVVTYEDFISFSPAQALEAGGSVSVRLAVRLDDMTDQEMESMLMIADDLGDRFYFPLKVEKGDTIR